jgi:DNA repair ATPase RecN
MLRFLRVRNFALIDQLELTFEEGFNLLSGETGAGKSIIVDALGLLAGSKATSEMIRTGENRAVVEAIFESDLKPELAFAAKFRRTIGTASTSITSRVPFRPCGNLRHACSIFMGSMSNKHYWTVPASSHS